LEFELAQEAEKFGGLKKIKIFERNPEGVVAVIFNTHAAANRFLEKNNGRLFDGRKLHLEFYDGWSNYLVKETEEQEKERLKDFEKWIEKEGKTDEKNGTAKNEEIYQHLQ